MKIVDPNEALPVIEALDSMSKFMSYESHQVKIRPVQS